MNIWQTWAMEPYQPTNLTADARLVLGLFLTCGITSPKQIADTIDAKTKEVQSILSLLKKSKHPVIRSVFRAGLPVEASAVLLPGTKKLYCQNCRFAITLVPCQLCASKAKAKLKTRITKKPDLPQIKIPTRFLPGSSGKIVVMRQRYQKGYSVFCKGDATFSSMRRRKRKQQNIHVS
jgi:hypothetical protein